MANLVTTLRLALLFVAVGLAYLARPAVQLGVPFLLVLVFALDAVDGWVARARREASVTGAVYDIAADRVVENVLWIVLADLDLVPVWIALLFVTRGLLVDAVRAEAAAAGVAPFDTVRSRLGRALVASRAMRGLYGAAKAATFFWAFLTLPWPALWPAAWTQWGGVAQGLTLGLALATVGLNLARGIPVLLEFALRPAAGRP